MRRESPRTIDFLIRNLHMGGAERQMARLVCGLAARGHAVRVVTFYDGGAVKDQLAAAGIPIECLHKGGRWDLVPFWMRLVRTLRARRPDILHSYMDIANLAGLSVLWRLPGTRLVWGVRTATLYDGAYDQWMRVVYRLQTLFAPWADAVICNSEAGREALRGRGLGANLHVVENGIDTDTFRPDPQARQRVRAQLGVAPDERLVAIVGRIDPIKDHATFLQAAALAIASVPRLRIAVIGSGPAPYRQGIEAIAAEVGLAAGALWVESPMDAIAGYYAACDLVVSSSRSEGFSNTLAEAMACGVACVATDVGDAARILGDLGPVVPPADPARLAQAMVATLQGDSEARARARRERIEQRFGTQRMVERTAELLDRVSAPRPSHA